VFVSEGAIVFELPSVLVSVKGDGLELDVFPKFQMG
jgi:hypothetical protein